MSAVGGPLDARVGVVHSPPNLPGWGAFPLREELRSSLGIAVAVQHDAAACALAEHRWGCPWATRLAYLTCGTGLGVGLVFDGLAYVGAHGRSPEIGHARWRDNGPVAYGKRGSVEAYASGTGLRLLAQHLFPQRWPEGCDGTSLNALAAAGDADAQRVLLESAQAVGGVAAWLADTLALDRIVVGSLARYLGAPWMQQVRETFQREVLPYHAQSCVLGPSELGERLQDCSALAVAVAAAG